MLNSSNRAALSENFLGTGQFAWDITRGYFWESPKARQKAMSTLRGHWGQHSAHPFTRLGFYSYVPAGSNPMHRGLPLMTQSSPNTVKLVIRFQYRNMVGMELRNSQCSNQCSWGCVEEAWVFLPHLSLTSHEENQRLEGRHDIVLNILGLL